MTLEAALEMPRRKRRWLWILLVILAGVICSDQIYRAIKHGQVRAELDSLRKEGYPINERELAVWHTAVPDQENAALRVLQAASDLSVQSDIFGRVSWGRTEELGPEERDELKAVLTNNSSALETLHSAVQLKDSRYPLSYRGGPSMLLPHLAKVKSLCQVLKAESVIAGDEKQLDSAVAAVKDSVLLARTLDTEPLLISQLVRIASLSISCTAAERLVNQQSLNENQLRLLCDAYAEADQASRKAFARGFVGELSLGAYCFSASPREIVQILNSDTPTGSPTPLPAQILFSIYGWSGLRDRDFLFYLKIMHRALNSSTKDFPEGLTLASETAREVEHAVQADRLLIFSRMLLPALQNANTKEAEAEAKVRTTLAGLAVQRYRLKNKGEIPASLNQLLPEYLARIPGDPFDGAPLRLQKLETGFVVYSIGPDGNDDGGLERSSNGNSGARRWPPAKEKSGRAKQSSKTHMASKVYDVTFTVDH